MRVIVIGGQGWDNYSEVMRQMTIILEDMKYYEDNNLSIVHTAGRGLEDMITEYVGKVQKFLKQKGISVREEIFRNPKDTPKSINDYNMITSGADYALIFKTEDDKRSTYCKKLLEEFQIPFREIKKF